MLGLFTNLPFVWVLLLLPVAWRGRQDQELNVVRTLLLLVFGFFAAALAVLGCFYGATVRYQIEMTSWVVLGAAITGFSELIEPCAAHRDEGDLCCNEEPVDQD